ncbi:MAG: hypothetical protein KF889_26900 [Alphaproteobacteria bacterium]|nr:hypothetical protein [Alphaproteobacteria bacterium]MCW5738621.1 hypothetical protein [Alphaproteobacteria bacterium]
MRRVLAAALLAVLALAAPARAQDIRGQERDVTRAELDEKAEPGRTTEEVRAALGRPLYAQCGGRIQLWGYRTESGRIDLMFVDNVLRMTILGGVGMSGAKGSC